MGRTQRTYRMRLEAERIQLTQMMKKLGADLKRYNKLWGEARNLSYAGSTFPYPEAWVVGTYQILLTLYMRIFELEKQLELSNNAVDDIQRV